MNKYLAKRALFMLPKDTISFKESGANYGHGHLLHFSNDKLIIVAKGKYIYAVY